MEPATDESAALMRWAAENSKMWAAYMAAATDSSSEKAAKEELHGAVQSFVKIAKNACDRARTVDLKTEADKTERLRLLWATVAYMTMLGLQENPSARDWADSATVLSGAYIS